MAEGTAAVVPPIKALRILAGALMGAIVVIGFAVVSAVPHHGPPPNWPYLVIVGHGCVIAMAINLVGYRVTPLPSGIPSDEAHRRAMAAYQPLMILRFALAESVAILALALTFAEKPSSVLTYAVGGLVSLALMAVHVWPSERLILKVQEQLDRDGGRSDLAAVLDGSVRIGD